jgi:Predicted 3'-5' exonuclease related to the exonuclease domain of PolB
MALVVTIKTVGDDLETFDAATRHDLLQGRNEQNFIDSTTVAAKLALSPVTGSILALAVYDTERHEGAVYYQSTTTVPDERLGACLYKVRDEATMLREFWQGVASYNTVVTFNGRAFTIPFIIHRSVAKGVSPTIDLERHRYLRQQVSPYHIDLRDQLTNYGAWQSYSSLSLFCRAYGIPYIQAEGSVEQDSNIPPTDAHTTTIAIAAGADVLATALLYEKWQTYLAPPLFRKSEKEIDF